MAYYKREKQKENNKSKELTMDAVDIIHTGKHLIPQETLGKSLNTYLAYSNHHTWNLWNLVSLKR